MKIITFLAFSAGLAVPFIAAAPAPAPDASFPGSLSVKYYPNGLPAGLYPEAQLTSRATNLETRQSRVGVFICSDANFTGRCVFVTSSPGQCGE